MEDDGPVSAVQIRLAKGDITTTQYREILSRLMKNISSFQQTSSLKTLQIRYAKSEVSSEQYQESVTNLMKNLYSHPWSPPLHILHNRYAEGELTSEQYEEMFTNLTHEEFSYDQSTPLWLLNNRYARGELSTQEYEEILSLFTDYPLHIQLSPIPPSEGIIPVSPGLEETTFRPPVPPKDPVSPPNQSISGLKSMTNQDREASDDGLIQPDEGSSIISDLLPDHPAVNQENILVDESPVREETLDDGITQILHEEGEESLIDSEVLSSHINTEESTPNGKEEIRPEQIPVHDNLPSIPDLPRNSEKPGVLPGSIHIPDLKSGVSPKIESHLFSSSLLSPPNHHSAEALPTDFLYPGGKHNLGMIAEEAGLPSSPEIRVGYSITPVSSSGGRANTYETVTSSISQSDSGSGQSDIESARSTSAGDKARKSVPNIRQQIKTLIVKGDYDEAIKLADSMISEDGQDYLPYFYKGMARYYLNIPSEAMVDLDHARELCKNKDEIRKIDTIREHILSKQRKTSESGVSSEPDGKEKESDQLAPSAGLEQPDAPDNLSGILDSLGKEAQKLIDNKDYKQANLVLSEFIGYCKDLPLERLQAESVDEIYAAMGFVRYQLKDYVHAKEFFQDALEVNAKNEVANQFMKDILIRAARKK